MSTRAATETDPVNRMALVAAFAVSQFASAKYRTIRKPFNCMMGETYEFTREDLGMYACAMGRQPLLN
jgi:hypothetical protein